MNSLSWIEREARALNNFTELTSKLSEEPMFTTTTTNAQVATLEEIETAIYRANQIIKNTTYSHKTYPSHEYMAQMFRSIYPHVLNAVMTYEYEETEEEENEDA